MKKMVSTLIFFSLLFISCNKDISINPSKENNNLPATVVFKNIPEGTFTMGGTTIQEDAPEVNVTLTGFQISEKEITNEQYIDFFNRT